MSAKDEKQRIRHEMALRRSAVPKEVSERAGERVAAVLSELPELRNARRIALYAALDDELPTRPLFDALRPLGIPLLMPLVTRGESLAFFPVAEWEELRVGHFGVLEPKTDTEPIEFGKGDIVITPGVAFDRAGHRLGRGRAYYDRTFAADSETGGSLLLGLGYEFQVLPSVPTATHDRDMDGIATEQRVIWIERGAS